MMVWNKNLFSTMGIWGVHVRFYLLACFSDGIQHVTPVAQINRSDKCLLKCVRKQEAATW